MVRDTPPLLSWDQPDLVSQLHPQDNDALDHQPFGVIGFTENFHVDRYNRYECDNTGLTRQKVLGHHVFTQVAQCMNNFMVAQKFEDAKVGQTRLDERMPYVLTWRMRPTAVKLRLLWDPEHRRGYILLNRSD